MAFTESLHPRVAGKFADKNAPTAAKKSTAGKNKSESFSFDGKRGTGYGKKGGDARIKLLQKALNRLGLTDSRGNKLAVDGKLGPRTTAAIKKAQRKLGMKATGVVTMDFIRQLAKAKSLQKPKAEKPKKVVPAKKAAKPAPAKKQAPRKAAPVVIKAG